MFGKYEQEKKEREKEKKRKRKVPAQGGKNTILKVHINEYIDIYKKGQKRFQKYE